ncbi:MAG: DUF2202 domain-containing protein [Nevskiales bacterium]|nr:DUF2202 domain-containing protein [Nevskiales bacterium]
MNPTNPPARHTALVAAGILCLGLLSACGSGNGGGPRIGPDGATPINLACQLNQIDALPVEALSDAERDSIIFMREEEKLARDVYLSLGDIWTLPIFDNIADSEETHMDAVKLLLDRYQLDDPAAGNGVGEFTNTALQTLYDQLVARGSTSLIEALTVGALIEDLDIYDLQNQLDSIVDNQDIANVWANLEKGSRNHLRSFSSRLLDYGVTYVPEYITQDAYDAIINSPYETGGC